MDSNLFDRIKEFVGRHRYTIVLVLFLLIIVVIDENSLINRIAQKREMIALKQQIEEYSEQMAHDEAILRELSDDSLVLDRLAREKYNMKRDDEDVFIEKSRREVGR